VCAQSQTANSAPTASLTPGCSSAARTSASIAQFQERSLSATDAMFGELRRDYARMAGMIIGAPPEFDEVMASVAAVQNEINR